MLTFWWVVCCACPQLSATRGVAPENEALYRYSTFMCDDGRVIPIERVNDNFCDCVHGEDEPGTSACSIRAMQNKTFYCPNPGHRPQLLFRSQVDDGICDCCDGSDEPLGTCPNTCIEANSREKRENMLRKNAIADGKLRKAEIVAQSNVDRQSLDAFTRKKRDQITAISQEIQHRSALGECIREFTEGTKSHCLSVLRSAIGLNAVVKAILYNDFCVSWAPMEDDHANRRDFGCSGEVPSVIEGLCLCGDDKSYLIATGHIPTTCGFVCYFKRTFPIQEEKTVALQLSYDENVVELESLLEKTQQDYGPSGDFFGYRSRTVSKEMGEYVYTVGFFDRVTQQNRRDGSIVNCGEWKGFVASNYAAWGSSVDYGSMKFADGDPSWSGAVRSTSVRLLCGPIDEIIDVTEDPPCVYTMVMKSPLACDTITVGQEE